MTDKLLINEVAQLLNIEPSTIRYWEKQGLVHLIRDEDNNYRYFDNHSLVELMDIMFYRKLQIPIKELQSHLTADIHEKKAVLQRNQKKIDQWIHSLEASSTALKKRLALVNETEQLAKEKRSNESSDIPFEAIEAFDLYHQAHAHQYIDEPSDFVMMFEGSGFSKISEGLNMKKSDTLAPVIWQKNAGIKIYFAGLLKVNASQRHCTNLLEIKQEQQIDDCYQRVIAQYLTSGTEESILIDYYKCWFIKDE
ncbi:MAG: MerR family transcriptional regulator [Enterococcus sp.]